MNVQDIHQQMADPQFAAHGEQRLTELLNRSATDANFRNLLLTEPRAAIAEFIGNEVPEDLAIHFVENEADLTIVLPDPTNRAIEISDADLDTVAGGITPAALVMYIAYTAAGAAGVIGTLDYFDVI